MTEAREGLLLVTRNLPPLRGGMERLNERLVIGLPARSSVAVVGPAGCAPSLPASAVVRGVPAAPLWKFLVLAAWRALVLSRLQRPSLVLAGSGLTAPIAWALARLTGARSAAYLHGLDLVASHPIYQALWLPCIRRCDVLIANSRNTCELAVARGVPVARIHVVHPGTDIPEVDPAARARFRARHALAQAPVMLSVGRLTARKGLVEFVRDVLPRVVAQVPEAKLVVIGAEATDALTSRPGTRESERILEAAQRAGVRDSILMLPPCTDAELADAYRGADVHVFPIIDVPGDVEGFGMVAIEAAAHGLPTVAHAVGGVADAVKHGVSGSLVPLGDAHAFAEELLRWIAAGPAVRLGCRTFAEGFSWRRFSDQLHAALGI